MTICIAGKNDIAVKVLQQLYADPLVRGCLCVVLNQDDTEKHTWQQSLGFTAKKLGVPVYILEDVYQLEDLLFVSVEFDRIVKPSKFASDRLYNIHFSALPAHRGVSTAVWPILGGDEVAGVTFHEIDQGIDTGSIVEQITFPLTCDFTSRDLYFKLMDEGEKLVVKIVREMVQNEPSRPASAPQDESFASCHFRKDIDFSQLDTFLEYNAEGVSRFLRAFHFFEYQLPCISGMRIYKFELTDVLSERAAGSVAKTASLRYTLATEDYDVLLVEDPYQYLFAYASGENELPLDFDWSLVDDWDKLNGNGWSMLMVACYAGNIIAVRDFLDKGADVNKSNYRGTTALMYARSCQDPEKGEQCFRYLLDAGADQEVKDATGRDVASYLLEAGQTRFLEVLN